MGVDSFTRVASLMGLIILLKDGTFANFFFSSVSGFVTVSIAPDIIPLFILLVAKDALAPRAGS